jgi:hypothetical protein
MYSKKKKAKSKTLPKDMEQDIRDYKDKKKNIKEKIFEDKPTKTKPKTTNKKKKY